MTPAKLLNCNLLAPVHTMGILGGWRFEGFILIGCLKGHIIAACTTGRVIAIMHGHVGVHGEESMGCDVKWVYVLGAPCFKRLRHI